MNDAFLPQGRYPENFVLISQLEVCQERGFNKGGTWRTLSPPDRTHGWQGHSWRNEWCLFSPRKIPWKFCVDMSIGSVSGRRGKEGGFLEDIEGSWLETWRTWSFLMSWMIFFTPRKIPWKFRVDISIESASGRGGKKGGTWRTLRVPDQTQGGCCHSCGHEWCFFYPKEDTLKILCWYLNNKCVKNGEGQEGGYLEDVEGSWSETWRTGSSLTFLMCCVDPKDHILKLLLHYLHFWLKYNTF